jgi:hypothetical protein
MRRTRRTADHVEPASDEPEGADALMGRLWGAKKKIGFRFRCWMSLKAMAEGRPVAQSRFTASHARLEAHSAEGAAMRIAGTSAEDRTRITETALNAPPNFH